MTACIRQTTAQAVAIKMARDALDGLTDDQFHAIAMDRSDRLTPERQQRLGDAMSRIGHMRDRANTPNTFREIEGHIE